MGIWLVTTATPLLLAHASRYSTTFSLHGEYDRDEDDKDACPIEITRGFRKDSLPKLNQVVLQIISANKSTLPIWIEVSSGNTSDRKSIVQTIRCLRI